MVNTRDKTQRILYTWPDQTTFKPDEEEKLAQKLLEIDEATGVEPITSLRMVQMDQYGKTLWGGYRMTVTAFNAVTTAAAPGLGKLIPNLVGMNRRADQPREYFSFEKGVSIYNKVVDLRFDELTNKRFVLNRRDRLVEGVLGPKYKYLDNSTYFQLAQDVVSGSSLPVQFSGARLAGRQLSLRFKQSEPIFSVGDDPYFAGFHFSNTEMGGSAIKAGVTLERKQTGFSCFLEVGRVPHKGKDFKPRLKHLLAKVLDRAEHLNKVEKYARQLKGVRLGLGVREEDRKQRMSELTEQFKRRGMRHALAQRIVRSAMLQGSDDKDPSTRLSKAILAKRTAYDLFNAAIREASSLPLELQEQAEGIAYELISGKFSVR